ncbi:MAG: TPM domain-containing protein [Pseudomonadota bacterium]
MRLAPLIPGRLLLACLLLIGPASAFAQKFPPLTGRVVDAANLLSPEQEAQLTRLSAEIEKASSRQFVVATVPDLQGYPIEDYGNGLIRAWKIGQKEANNGMILIVAPNERRVRVEVGYGLEPVMTDALSSLIVNDVILPKFRDKDVAGGIMAGAAEIGAQMKLPLEAAEVRGKQKLDQARPAQRRGSGGGVDVGGFVGIFWVVVILFFVFFSAIGGRGRGRRYRGGGGGGLGPIILWSLLSSAGRGGGGGGWGGGGGSSWGGGGGFGGGFSGGGGSGGGGGASGSW